MISRRLHRLFGLSIPFFIIHGVEEYWFGFYDVYPLFHSTATIFQTTPQGIFLVFQIMWWLMLLMVFLTSLGGEWQLIPMTMLGLIYLYELNHPFGALFQGSYYPGLLTSLPFPIIAFLFWRELLRIFRSAQA